MLLKIELGMVEQARAQSKALDALIAAVWPEAYRLALAILRDRGLAEDAAQEACAAIARSLPSLKNAAAFPAWSYKVIASYALTSARRRRPTQNLESLADRSVGFDPSATIDLYDALGSLTPQQRAVILLHYYAGLSSVEIAAATRLPSSTIRFHLMLARRALRTALSATSSALSPHEALTDVR